MVHYEKYKILEGDRAMVEKKLNTLNEKYETDISGITISDKGIVLVVGLYPKYKV